MTWSDPQPRFRRTANAKPTGARYRNVNEWECFTCLSTPYECWYCHAFSCHSCCVDGLKCYCCQRKPRET